MKPLLISVDPGSNGAICELWPDGKIDAFPIPDDADLRDYFKAVIQHNTPICYLEQVSGYIGKPQPGSTMFVFGDGYGYIRGLLAANHIKTVLVRPQKWQAGIPGMTSLKGPDRKRALKEHAARLYPQVKVTLGNADALLIAAYGQKMEGGQ
jgi:hypothetical protein